VEDIEEADALQKQGRPTKAEEKLAIRQFKAEAVSADNPERILRRLARDHPEILAEMKAGKF
jgi:hypothetical protein